MDKDSKKASRVGLYSTISFHLIVLIVLLIISISEIAGSETSFVLDFTKQEELEKLEREIEQKEIISKNLDDIISTRHSEIRNVAVDASGENLKDDRNGNDVYKQARELQAKLDASKREAMSQEKSEDVVDTGVSGKSSEDKKETKAYTGPSVISFRLDGRKKEYLPVPAYKGYGSGDVTVSITVNQSGRVISASVVASASTNDTSLHEYAIEAAKRSRFSASTSAPAKQTGEIVYRFIAQ